MKEGSSFQAAFAVAQRLCLLAVAITVVTGCGGAPKKEALTLSIQAAEDVNPDLQGRPSPIVVHVLELKSVETFNSLDYTSLTDPSGAALGADRLNGTQSVIPPGGVSLQEFELDAGTAAIGIVAGYRDIDNASWRQAVPISQGDTRKINVQLGQFQMSTSTQD